jgi:hypothetical protein
VSISGDAFTNIQFADPSDIAIDDWVRAVYPGALARTAWQLVQLQFHCGNPPPAAEPRTLIFIVAFFRGKKNPASLKGYPGLCEPSN